MNNRILWKLFISTLYLSAFTFGGGYVIVTLMKKKFVDDFGWIDEEEMLDFVAIAQSAPGPVAVNCAIVVGYKLAGMIGVSVAVIATIIPPFIIISLISVFYTAFRENTYIAMLLEGMQAGVGAVISAVSCQLGSAVVKERQADRNFIMISTFVLSFLFKISVVYIIIACVLSGVIKALLSGYREVKR